MKSILFLLEGPLTTSFEHMFIKATNRIPGICEEDKKPSILTRGGCIKSLRFTDISFFTPSTSPHNYLTKTPPTNTMAVISNVNSENGSDLTLAALTAQVATLKLSSKFF